MKPQHERILKALAQPGGSTTIQMQRDLNIVDVRKRISELRRLGFFIRDEEARNATSGTHKRYWLEEGSRAANIFRWMVLEKGWDAITSIEAALDAAATEKRLWEGPYGPQVRKDADTASDEELEAAVNVLGKATATLEPPDFFFPDPRENAEEASNGK